MHRESLGTSEELIIELKQKVTDLEAARAAGEAAVQTHLAMREQQTQRIRKAKAGGLKGEHPPAPPFPDSPGTPHPPYVLVAYFLYMSFSYFLL